MNETIKDKLRRLEDPDRPQGTGEYWNACGEALDEIERLEKRLAEREADWQRLVQHGFIIDTSVRPGAEDAT